mmetsp:Transcript_10756/g.35696  ORF Transcript_10756/g.35696 Transcript_10756/m.35696 type:complete len:255 (-) Transcript_10756:290-1054(-)
MLVMFSFSLKAAMWSGVRPLRSGKSMSVFRSTLEWLSSAMMAASDFVDTARCSAVQPLTLSSVASDPMSSSTVTMSGWLYSAANMSGVLPCLSCQLASSCSRGVAASSARVGRISPARASLCNGISPFSSSIRKLVLASIIARAASASLNSHACKNTTVGSAAAADALIGDASLTRVTPADLRTSSDPRTLPPRPRLLRRDPRLLGSLVLGIFGGLSFFSFSIANSASFVCISSNSRIVSSDISSSARSSRLYP